MQCRYCGAINGPRDKTCILCGKALDQQKAVRQPAPEPEPVQPPAPVQSPPRDLTPEEHIRIGELIYAAYKHKEAGAIEDAIVACQGALALNDRSAPAHSLLGSLYESKGDIPSAIYQFEKVQALDPGNVANQQKIASLRQAPRIFADDASASAGKWKFPIKMDRVIPYVPIVVPAVVFVAVLAVLFMTVGKNRAAQDRTTFVPPKQNIPQTTSPVTPGAQMPGAQMPDAGDLTRMAQPYLGPGQVTPGDQTRNRSSKDGREEQNTPQRTGPVQVPVPKSGVVSGPHTPAPLPPMSAQPAPKPSQSAPPVITPIEEQPRPSMRISTPPPTPAPKPKPAPQPVPQTADPEARAMQYQGSGKYQEAISSYRDALNRTSDPGRIYQQIAICQQRLGQREQAVSSYKSAIRSYRDQLSAGRDASEVQRNIRSCEAGIDVLTNQGQ